MSKLSSIRQLIVNIFHHNVPDIKDSLPAVIRLALYILLLTTLLTNNSLAAETHGLISMDDFYSKDTGSSFDLHILTARLRVDTDKLNTNGNISVHFDGRVRSSLSSGDYKSPTKNERIDTLNLTYTGQQVHLSVGRLWPEELPVERVDGINIVSPKKDLGIGFFGGIKPNPYTDTFDPDFTAMGAYIFFRKPLLSTSLALTYNGYKGSTDREYIYGQLSYSPTRELTLYNTLTADIKKESRNLVLTNGIVELSYRPDYKKSITIGYNQFQTFQYFRSMKFDVNHNRQNSYYVSANYRFLEKYTLYGRIERQSMYYPAIQTNLKNSDNFRLGLSGDNLLNTGINMNVSTFITDSYNSKNTAYNMELSRLTREWLQLILTSSWIHNKYELNNYSNNTLMYGASGYLYLSKRWNVSLSYDHESGSDYTANRMALRTTAKF